MMKKLPGYEKLVKTATQKAVDDLEKMFQKQWQENDIVLNSGNGDSDNNDREDKIYNS